MTITAIGNKLKATFMTTRGQIFLMRYAQNAYRSCTQNLRQNKASKMKNNISSTKVLQWTPFRALLSPNLSRQSSI